MTSVEHPAGHTEPVDEIPVLELVVPFQGFPDHRRFALTRLDEQGLMCALRSMEDPDLRFVVVPPALFFDDYAPQVDDSLAQTLEADSADELLTLVVVNPGEGAGSATANLLAPVVVNHRTRRAAQVVLEDSSLPVRAPLVPAGTARDQHAR